MAASIPVLFQEIHAMKRSVLMATAFAVLLGLHVASGQQQTPPGNGFGNDPND
jgi:hypothetical protein